MHPSEARVPLKPAKETMSHEPDSGWAWFALAVVLIWAVLAAVMEREHVYI